MVGYYRIILAILAWLFTGLLSPAVEATEPSGTAGLSNSQLKRCEIHIWPAQRFGAMTSSWGLGFGAIGAAIDAKSHANGDAKQTRKLEAALDGKAQLEALVRANPSWVLDRRDYRVVTHDEPLDRKTIDRIQQRRFPSESPCYAELIVADIRYHKAAMYGASLRALFVFREFGASSTVRKTHKGWGANALRYFPVRNAEEEELAARELTEVLQDDFKEFGRGAPALAK